MDFNFSCKFSDLTVLQAYHTFYFCTKQWVLMFDYSSLQTEIDQLVVITMTQNYLLLTKSNCDSTATQWQYSECTE